MLADTSLEAYRALESEGTLQAQERQLMIFVHRLYPKGARFTRKELAGATTWTINVICGRVNSLVKKGFLTEYPDTRDGGHLLSIAQPNEPSRMLGERAEGSESRTQAGLLKPAAPAETPSPKPDTQAVERVAAVPCYDRNGKLLCYAEGFGPGWPPDQDHLHRKQRRAA